MLFDSWSDLGRVVVVGGAAYVALLLLLRISGKRTLTKFNAFDFVVTVALGSTLATVITSASVSLAEGVLALALLIFLQYAVTWASVRSAVVRRLVKAEPSLVLRHGEFLDGALTAQRLTRDEVLQALRGKGITDPAQVAAVVLETDGSISILTEAQGGEGMAMMERWSR